MGNPWLPEGCTHIPSPDEQERINMFLAWDLARRQLEDGTARAQVITHYLQMASPRENIERQQMIAKINLLEGQLEACRNDMRVLEMIDEAMLSLKEYRGDPQDENIF